MKVITPIALGLGLFLALGARAQTADVPEAERAAIIQTARDYGDGFYAGDAVRMERAIHPDFNKVVTMVFPPTKGIYVGYSSFTDLVELARAGVAISDPVRTIDPRVLWIDGDIACAKLTSPMFNDYLQMVKIDGDWKIINVLWTQGPEVPSRQPLTGFDPEKENAAAAKTAEDFVVGALSGDAVRVEAALHPEVSRAVFQKDPQSGRVRISRNGFSALVEPVRAKLQTAPENQRKTEIKVLDIMDGMAFIVASAPQGSSYIQMSWLNGQWKIFNILVKAAPRPVPAPKK
ncbi:MAG: nuclear transport factor 2 family protein [Candidatus Aminicenantes bacterium]|nr:nuclear transport factor 2 family protein [Candidatus Aminicenantes bacterium]